MYTKNNEIGIEKEKGAQIVQACAGFNHSLALSKGMKGYSWGYSGKGVLGREAENSS